MLRAEDAGADWPWVVIGSEPADTTAPEAAEVDRDAVAATGTTDAPWKQGPPGSSPLPGPAQGLRRTMPRDTGAKGGPL